VGAQVPELFVGAEIDDGPERETLLADAVGAALWVVFDVLSPAERLAFVLHDVFGLPFEEIGPLVDRSPAAARQLASRARRRVRQDGQSEGDDGQTAGRSVVRAFFAAARGGDFDALLHVLDPEVLMRVDGGAAAPAGVSALVQGAQAVAQRALMFARPDALVYPATVNGGPGVVVLVDGAAVSAMAFQVRDGRVAAIDAVVDRSRLAQLDLDFLDTVGAI
jgi:RNA polymerase sigma-70 factor (ECF subfamily)